MGYNTITVKTNGYYMAEEAIANAAITPGHLLDLMSTGKVRVHPTPGGNADKIFAIEDDMQGNGIDDAYAADDRVFYRAYQRGDEVYALLANGEDVSIGDYLESAGDGTLQKYVADISGSSGTSIYPNQIVGKAKEAVHVSDSSGDDSSAVVSPGARILVEIV